MSDVTNLYFIQHLAVSPREVSATNHSRYPNPPQLEVQSWFEEKPITKKQGEEIQIFRSNSVVEISENIRRME